jgi:DNA mismatch repair protein MutS2
VHGTSDSGQTLYVEPQVVLEQNNALIQAKAAYSQEIQKILRICTNSLRNYLQELSALFSHFSRLDELVMRARWAVEHNCNKPVISSDHLELKGVRHPLLGRNAVPLDIRFHKGRRIIVITGPNTGGKTVALKTLGLIGLLVRFGVPIPADPDSQVPWFPQVFADIGDEQSIEESLSTFSAHVKNLGSILRMVESNALVLIDELGTGTDPREGGAIALAVLEALVEKNCYAFVTTHHGSVKAYAYEHGEVENASMIFDNQTLSPTFHIQYGVPGESHAIDTAQRVGFPPEILRKAREFAQEEGSRLELLLERLAAEEQKLKLAIERTNRRDQELKSSRDEVNRLKQDLEVRETKLKSDQLGEANQYLQDARKEMNRLIQEIKLSGNSLETKALHSRSQEIGTEFKEAYEKTRTELREKRQRERPVLSPGMKVRIDGSTQTGTLVSKVKPDKWLVYAGMLKLTVVEDQIEPSDGDGVKKRFFIPDVSQDQYLSGKPLDQGSHITKAQFTMDLRGKRLHEAITELELQIDNAQVQGLYFFTIIHGKGTGALQKGVHEYLHSLSSVQSYAFARPEDGGTGKTLVYLKEE